MSEFIQINLTCADKILARHIAKQLVEQNLAACAQIIDSMTSIYHWQGKIEQDAESLIQLKSHISLFEQIEQQVKTMHPYDVPEIIAIPLVAISKDYQTWLSQNCAINNKQAK
ncbi:divalent-cation tolerance protein CutA [Catenovulum sp. 2E275]|uniref:divalent-cation tolerance protein CutA n=1 Tax=Catenovulum sp. 2E275 TaxID=2980497 RepID=UPI0021D0CC60|nr:divalent-cation tolerance protein CutA [Catenovulum sp. 2E275]MCU4676300.1 divalent-cation tolerance protein CutA [Catenovulum sp. 2E275]